MTIIALPSSPDKTASTFADNMKLPVHRWFRFSAGFSAQWVETVIDRAKKRGNVTLLDLVRSLESLI